MRPRTGPLAVALAAALLASGCPPTMIERDGRRVFNPRYLGFLESPARDAWQQPERVLDALEVEHGGAVADIGAGGGYFTERLAARVGPAGTIYATDVQEEMIRALRARAAEKSLTNVRVIHAGFDEPMLPSACCGLVLFSAVYKEIQDRPAYMRRLAPALREGGRVAILGFRPEAPGAGPPPDVRLSAEEVITELAAAGYTLAERHDFLPRQYLLVFVRSDPA